MRRALLGMLMVCATANAQTIDCDQTLRGHLAPGGTNVLSFRATPGQYVQAVVYPLTASLTNPSIAFEPPATPALAGRAGAAVAYVTPWFGLLNIAIASQDPAATGDYAMALTCHAPPYPARLDCVDQYILCGQTAEWELTPASCRFHDAPDKAYAEFTFYGNAGDLVSADVETADYPPIIGIYDKLKGGAPLGRSRPITDRHDQLIFPLPFTGLYDILVTSRVPSSFGPFKLTMHDCASPGCLPPVLVDVPADVVVPYGTAATLTASAVGAAALRYSWIDRAGLPEPVAQGASFTTPRITAPRFYSVTAVTPCGSADSRIISVRPARGRATRH